MKFLLALSSLCLSVHAFAPIANGQNKPLSATVAPVEEVVNTNDWLHENFHQVAPSDIFGDSKKQPEDHDWFPQALRTHKVQSLKGLSIGDSKAALSRPNWEAVMTPSVPPAAPSLDSLSFMRPQPMAKLESVPAFGSRGQAEWFSQSMPEVAASTPHSRLDTTGANEWFMQAIN